MFCNGGGRGRKGAENIHSIMVGGVCSTWEGLGAYISLDQLKCILKCSPPYFDLGGGGGG